MTSGGPSVADVTSASETPSASAAAALFATMGVRSTSNCSAAVRFGATIVAVTITLPQTTVR